MQNHPENLKHNLSPPIPLPPYAWYPPSYGEEDEVNLLDYFRIIKRHWGKIFLLTFLITGLATVASFLMSKKYQAEVSLMPITQSSGGGGGLASLASSVSSIPMVGGSLSGLTDLVGSGKKSGQIISILKSRTLIEGIINEFDLMHVFYKKRWDSAKGQWKPDFLGEIPTMEDAVKRFRKKVMTVKDDKKTQLITIQVEMKDPLLAAQVANRLIVELQDFISKNQLTVAKRNRIFIEGQLQENKVDLLEAGKKLNEFYGGNRISSIQPQVDVNIGKIQGPPKTFEEIRDEMSQLEQQKLNLNEKLIAEEKSGIVRGVPSQVYLQYMTLQRELSGRVNALLTQQYEMAKIEEAKEDLTFQVIDKAVPPVRPSWPKKVLIVPLAFVGGLFLSIFLAFFLEYVRKMKEAEKSKKHA